MRRFVAPGRANLIGEHTDHTGGLVLPLAIDRAITLDCEVGGDQIRLTSREERGHVDLPADGSTAGEGWGRFVAAVAYELDRIGRRPVGIVGHLSSDIPAGAGLSSSAALEVVVALALCAAADLELEPIELAQLCRRAEHRAVGVPSGIMDQAASVLGRRGSGVLVDCTTLEHRYVPLPRDHRIVVLHTGVRRTLEGSGYGERIEQLSSGLGVLGGRRPADVQPTELDDLVADLDPLPARRLRHVVTENARVRTAEKALCAGDLGAIRTVMAASHASLRSDFEVSIAELDAMVELALGCGATAARMTGGGFGGCAIALVATPQADALADEVIERYRDRFDHLGAAAHVCDAADGAGER